MLALSFSQTYNIELESFDDGLDFNTSTTRARFESLCLGLFRYCRYGRSPVSWKDSKKGLSQVFGFGGSSLIPMLQKLLAEHFPKTQLSYHN